MEHIFGPLLARRIVEDHYDALSCLLVHAMQMSLSPLIGLAVRPKTYVRDLCFKGLAFSTTERRTLPCPKRWWFNVHSAPPHFGRFSMDRPALESRPPSKPPVQRPKGGFWGQPDLTFYALINLQMHLQRTNAKPSSVGRMDLLSPSQIAHYRHIERYKGSKIQPKLFHSTLLFSD